MKKINSIGYGLGIIGAAAVFMIVIPAAAHLIWTFTSIAAFQWVSKISLVLSVLIVCFLIILLTIEHFQDKRINRFFAKNTKSKLPSQTAYTSANPAETGR